MSDNTKFGPPKGMRDWLPQETLLRQKLIRLIEHHYQLYGFQPIDTPVMENIEVLQGKGGGENEKLMFQVMKRGGEFDRELDNNLTSEEKFEVLLNHAKAIIKNDNDENLHEFRKSVLKSALNEISRILKDEARFDEMGLRFDLTVPLARYYSNHSNDLPKPFRCYHIGPVWRADRPQKGRFREFYQCDIDVVGSASDSAEVELLLATSRVLKELNIGNFIIRISHKAFLPMWFEKIGVPKDLFSKVAIIFDKADKSTFEELQKELSGLNLQIEITDKIEIALRSAIEKRLEFSTDFSPEMKLIWDEMILIQKRVLSINRSAKVVFDPFLVRGFDYYTGPVFEIKVEDKDFAFSIGGGGRYDGLIEKLGGPKNTPAVGISLGFERILLILMEKAKASTQIHAPKVFIVNNSQSEDDILALAEQLRSEGIRVETSLEGNKKLGQQLEGAQKNSIEYAITKFTPGEKTYTVRKLSDRQDKEMSLAELCDLMKRLTEAIEG